MSKAHFILEKVQWIQGGGTHGIIRIIFDKVDTVVPYDHDFPSSLGREPTL